MHEGNKNKRAGAGKRVQLEKDMAWLRKKLSKEKAACRKTKLQKNYLSPMKCRAFTWVVRSMQGFKCDRCNVIDSLDGMGGLDEMGPEVWAVNWDHHPISRESAELRYPNQIWEPVSQWVKAGNIGKMIDELGRVRLVHRYCHTLAWLLLLSSATSWMSLAPPEC